MGYKELGQMLKRAREGEAYSLRELEADSGVHRNTIHKLESGAADRTSFEVVVKLARALELSLDELAKAFPK